MVLKMYHGSPYKFKEFDSGECVRGIGFFFTDSYEVARDYSITGLVSKYEDRFEYLFSRLGKKEVMERIREVAEKLSKVYLCELRVSNPYVIEWGCSTYCSETLDRAQDLIYNPWECEWLDIEDLIDFGLLEKHVWGDEEECEYDYVERPENEFDFVFNKNISDASSEDTVYEYCNTAIVLNTRYITILDCIVGEECVEDLTKEIPKEIFNKKEHKRINNN